MGESNWEQAAWRIAFKVVALCACIIGLIWFVHKIAWVIGLVVISILIVYSIFPFSAYLTRKGLPHFISVLASYFIILFSVLLFFYLIIPTLISEMRLLARYLATDYSYLLPQMVTQFDEFLLNENLLEALQSLSQDLPNILQRGVTSLIGITANFFSGVTEVVIVLFLVFYLLRDLEPLKIGIIKLFPVHLRQEATHVLEIIDLKVGAYLRGNLIRCSIVGLLTGMILAIIGMPFALILGILAALLNIIVYIGPYMAGIPAVLLALAPDTPNPLIIIVLYVFVQAIDGFLLVPLLLGKAVDLRPFTIIISLLVGGKLLGIIGVILAIPIAAMLKVFYYHYYLKEDRDPMVSVPTAVIKPRGSPPRSPVK